MRCVRAATMHGRSVPTRPLTHPSREADIAPDEKHIVTASYDKTWKYWAHKDEF